MAEKILIYQVLPRLFGNDNSTHKENGSIEENGCGKFSAFDDCALQEIRKMGFTHVWYTGVLEHASKTDYSCYGIRNSQPDVVKGNAGSPYAIRDYYDVTPDLADQVENRMAEFEDLIGRTHACGLKVIIDFVPNHVAREYFSDARPVGTDDFGTHDDTSKSFVPGNNFYYIPGQPLQLQFPKSHKTTGYYEFPAKASGNDKFDNTPTIHDWYETVKLNYGVDYSDGYKPHFDPIPDTWLKMRDILLFWTGKGVDGFRCDMAEMVPVPFWNWVLPIVKRKNDSVIFIAEIYQPPQYYDYVYRGFFDYLYDKVCLYDTLRDIICGKRPASDITACWQKVEGLQDKMVNFLENHDEQRIASDFFAKDPFKAIPGMIVAATMNVNPVMVYFGQELGEPGMDKEGFSGRDGRTSIFDYWSVDTVRAWRNGGAYNIDKLTGQQIVLREFYIRLFHICHEEETIRSGKFYDLMYVNYENPAFDPHKQYAYLRYQDKKILLVVANFGKPAKIRIHMPSKIFNDIQIDPKEIKKSYDLFSGEEQNLDAEWETALEIDIDAHSGRLIRLE